jgi:hypothetical protein
MHGKGLTALLIALCLFAGCGGGGGGSSTGAGEEGSSASTQGAPAALQKLKGSAKRIEEERSKQAQAPAGEEEGEGKAGGGETGAAPPTPDPTPTNAHHDRGGGAAQFANKGGDNSIQEYGSEASAAEREAAAAVLHAYFDARVAHQWSAACFYMAAGLVVSMEQFAVKYSERKGIESCPQVLAALATDSSQRALEETAEADVGSLRTEGERAFLLYHGPHNAPYAMPMVREGGAWKVGSLEGAPLE